MNIYTLLGPDFLGSKEMKSRRVILISLIVLCSDVRGQEHMPIEIHAERGFISL